MAASGPGTFFGLSSVLFGAWLVDSAVQNRAPLKTLTAVLQNPRSARTLATGKGTAYPTAAPASFSGPSSGAGGSGSGTSPQAAVAVAFARSQIGKPYKWGATGPDSYDCSGLVKASYAHAEVSLPRTTAQMILIGSPVSKANLQIGDLVFPDPGHVALYSGNGNFIEAPRTGFNVREVPMWGFMTARRVVFGTSSGSVVNA